MATCALCGTMAEGGEGDLPAGWSLATDERGVSRICVDCTRINIRAIEGKLPEEWWE
ncbi:MAG: hypothetical protein ACRD0U_02985 [Acidimicrobiales bacterium]